MASPQYSSNNNASHPVELHYIKVLFLQKRYRQCIQACRDFLKNDDGSDSQGSPIQHTFISFYLGLAHEELARLMHDYSSAKLPSFKHAEQYYYEAIKALPRDIAALKQADQEKPPSDEEDPFTESTMPPVHSSPPASDEYDPFNYSTPSFPDLSSSPLPVHDDLSTRSPQTTSRETSSSDLDSHSSFDQIMTPHKVMLERDAPRMSLLNDVKGGGLERDVSRMSLLDDVRPTGLARGVSRLSLLDSAQRPSFKPSLPRSTSQGLMRPIRLGSPPKTFHVPPRLPYSGGSVSTSRLPRLNTWQSPSRIPSSIREEREWEAEEEPPSPVSPLRYGDAGPNDSPLTVSPISPETPLQSPMLGAYNTSGAQEYDTAIEYHESAGHDLESTSAESTKPGRVSEHISALQEQLQTHLRLLAQAKEATLGAQSKRASSRASAALSTGSPLPLHRASTNGDRPTSSDSKHDSIVSAGNGGKKLSRERSFWSFTPVDVKAEQMRRRVQEGRDRGWARERFDAEKYRALAEKALAEL